MMIDLCGLRRALQVRQKTDQILAYALESLKKATSGLEAEVLPLDVLQNILDMVPKKRTSSVVQRILQILHSGLQAVSEKEPNYFKLRSLLGVNAFPFDVDYLSLSPIMAAQDGKPGDGTNLEHLPCDFTFLKLHQSYELKASLS